MSKIFTMIDGGPLCPCYNPQPKPMYLPLPLDRALGGLYLNQDVPLLMSLKKKQYAPRPSEQPPVRGEKCQNVVFPCDDGLDFGHQLVIVLYENSTNQSKWSSCLVKMT